MEEKKKKTKETSFEEDLAELEVTVKGLESGNVPLDDAIDQFNKAMKLANKCSKKLKSAEESINKILNEDGTLSDFTVQE